jgi:ABC-type transport system involved in multi-copper enzyme maturation permease subunit
MPVLIIARLTLFEAVRRRLVLAVILLTPLVVGTTGWGFAKLSSLKGANGVSLSASELTLNYAIFVVLISFMFSVVLTLGSVFLAAPAVASDLESGLALAIFPRPIRRSSIILGKWLGLSTLVAVYATITTMLELVTIEIATGYMPPHPVYAVVFITWQSLVMLTLALAVSTRLAPMTCGVILVVLFGVTWIVGIAQAIGSTFNNDAIVTAGTIVSLVLPTDGLWRGAIYNLSPAVVRAAGLRVDPLGVTGPPTTAYLVWAVCWIAVVLACGIWSLNRRDL